MKKLIFLLCLASSPVSADVLVPIRTIRAKEIITAQDIAVKTADIPGAFTDPGDLIGQEARVALYAGRPVRFGDVGPPAIINRNDIVVLTFSRGGLRIVTEGRALGRGAPGEALRAMNMTSRTTVTGLIRADGTVEVR
ncbi:flagellar basal body P-ring formation chaperone FlgA [Arenibacterium sp. CAU 1754]